MNTFPDGFHHIRLELAREQGHPEGDRHHGYDLVAPLTPDSHLDAAAWRGHAQFCRIRRFRPGESDAIGKLARKPGGQWHFDYGGARDGDETCFRFGDERFVPGEYVSILEDDGRYHTFQVREVHPL